ncbi:MAG: 5'-nucleotidase C-terminal domain-containing protein, partial [Chloroflexota bacterium]
KLAVYNDNKELNRVIGTARQDISGSNELGSLMTDAVTALDEIDIAFQNNGGIRLDYLKKGPVTVKDIYKLDPFGNEIILFRLTPAEIKSLIKNSYEKADKSIDLQVSGLTYTIIQGRDNKVKKVILKLDSGKKIKKDKLYNVGINSYIASSYIFDHKDSGRSIYLTTAQALINYITKHEVVDYKGIQRTFIK